MIHFKLKYLLPLGLLALSLKLTSCGSETNAKEQPSSGDHPDALPVDVRLVSSEPINEEEVIAGSTAALASVDIVSELPKKIRSVHFRDGSFVSAGQLLYKLDDRDVKAKVSRINAELTLASINESRLSKLLAKESIKQEEYDQAKSKLEGLTAEKELLLSELQKTEIRAPFSGHIGLTQLQAGAFATPGAVLVTLENLSQIKVNFFVPEQYIHSVKPGTTIRYKTALSDDEMSAVITATEPSVNTENRSIGVQAISNNSSGRMKGGLSAQVFFSKSGSIAAVKVPTEALIPSANGYSVFVVRNATAKMAPVTVGNRTESEALVTSGLATGDSVMISNILKAADGMPVKVVTAN